MRNRLQTIMMTGKATLPVVILIFLCYWIMFFAPLSHIMGSDVETIINGLCYVAIGYILIEFNNSFSIIRLRTSSQTFIFFLLVMACGCINQTINGNLTTISILISLFFLFKSYNNTEATNNLFYSFLFIGIGSLLIPQIIYFSILWIYTTIRFKSFTIQNLFAMLIGWFFPYWLLFSYAFLFNKMGLFYQPFNEMIAFSPLQPFRTMQAIDLYTLSYILLLYIVSFAHYLTVDYEDKIQTRSYLSFLYQFTFFLFLFILFIPKHLKNLMPLLLSNISIINAHYLLLRNTKLSNLFFIISIMIFLFLLSYHIWILL